MATIESSLCLTMHNKTQWNLLSKNWFIIRFSKLLASCYVFSHRFLCTVGIQKYIHCSIVAAYNLHIFPFKNSNALYERIYLHIVQLKLYLYFVLPVRITHKSSWAATAIISRDRKGLLLCFCQTVTIEKIISITTILLL